MREIYSRCGQSIGHVLKAGRKSLAEARCINRQAGREPLDRGAHPGQRRIGILLSDVPEYADQPTQTRFDTAPDLGDVAQVRKSRKKPFWHMARFLEKIAHR